MGALPLIADTSRVLRDGLPLVDLRAPVEFARGAVPNAVNLPLLTDDERAAVGTCFKQRGQAAAIALGESLVSGAVRAGRIALWQSFVESHPDALLYCWRGGLRSERVQQWLAEAGHAVPRIAGGFKALRQTCLDALAHVSATQRIVVLAGRTGSGKTALLEQFANAVDLERLANHRGSAFGAAATAQPPPISFENALAVELLRRAAAPCILLEDESRTIGRIGLPDCLHAAMQRAPLVVLEVPRVERARHILGEYVTAPRAAGVDVVALRDRYLAAADRIARRLGGTRHATVRGAIVDAFGGGGESAHLRWIECLLEWYYDPMYDYQLQRKAGRVSVRGDRETVLRALAATGVA
jgi:tRNA 2-selenouridine synthase